MGHFGDFGGGVRFSRVFFSIFASGGQAIVYIDLKPILNVSLGYWAGVIPILDP